jgi:hypothetical protein
MSSHLEANLSALASMHPQLAQRLCLPVASAQVRETEGGPERLHRNGWSRLRPAPDAVQGFVDSAHQRSSAFSLGLGEGSQVLALLARRPDVEVSVWDRDPWLFRRLLTAHPLEQPLATGRLRLLLASDLVDAASTLARAPWVHPTARHQYAAEVALVEQRALGAGGQPFAFVLDGGLFVDDLSDALAAQGYRCWPFCADLFAVEELELQARTLRPALVAGINYKQGLAPFCEALGVPFFSWEIDPTTDRLAPLDAPAPRAHVFTYREAQVAEFKAAGFPHVEYLPLAANPLRRAPPARTPEETATYGVPVAFVGASLRDQVVRHRATLARLAPNAPDLDARLARVLEAQARDTSRYLVPELFAQHLGDLGLAQRAGHTDPVQVVGELAAADHRLTLIRALGSRGVHAWGDEGFAALAGSGATWRGPAGHVHELNRIYGNARVNVDIGRLYQRDIVTMRVFDVLACGGFLLTEWSDALPALFDVGRELDTFRTADELLAKVDHYLAHPDEARAIAERGRARVLRDHTTQARVKHMLGALAAS